MKYPGMESIDVVVKVKIDMTWRDAMKLCLAGLTNAFKRRN